MRVFEAGACSDRGLVRSHNEDSYRVDSQRGLFVVADGMGGHAAGEVASRIAVASVAATLGPNSAGADPGERLLDAVVTANRSIYEDAQAHPERQGMGTTLTLLCDEAGEVFLAHVGDSRAYRLRAGELMQLTRDHTWVNMQVRAGVITSEQAEHAQFRHVLVKALGTQPEIEPDVLPIEVLSRDRLLLCSDGLSDLVGDADLKRLLSASESPAETAARLVQEANARGGRDNVTAVVIDCRDSTWTNKLKSAVNKFRR